MRKGNLVVLDDIMCFKYSHHVEEDTGDPNDKRVSSYISSLTHHVDGWQYRRTSGYYMQKSSDDGVYESIDEKVTAQSNAGQMLLKHLILVANELGFILYSYPSLTDTVKAMVNRVAKPISQHFYLMEDGTEIALIPDVTKYVDYGF